MTSPGCRVRILFAVMGTVLLCGTAPSLGAAQQGHAPAPQQRDAQSDAPDQTTRTETQSVSIPARYQLRRGDVLELQFPFVPDFNQTTTVHPDGYVTLRVVGPLRADGLTLPELTQQVRAEYAAILRDPVITIELKEFEKPYFIVAGEVERPGKYDLRGETTATQAIAVAGGLKDRAKHAEAAIIRRLPGGRFEAKRLNLKKMLKEAQLNADLRLESGDMLFIPRGRRFNISDITSSLWILAWL
jgi:polysaccharide export outer membrane protein